MTQSRIARQLEHHEDQMLFAQEMGNDFANFRGPQLTEEFMKLSGLLDAEISHPEFDGDEKKALKFLIDDYGEAFKRYLALGYSMGMMDGFQNIPNSTYKTKVNIKPSDKAELDKQLSLPGMEK